MTSEIAQPRRRRAVSPTRLAWPAGPLARAVSSPRLGAFLLGAGALLAAADARGDCLRPRTAVVPASGTELPPNPVLYLFTPGSNRASELRVTDAGDRPVPFSLRRLPGPEAFGVHAVQVMAKAGTRLVVRPSRLDYDLESRYLVTESWRHPRQGRVTIERILTHSLPETCRGFVTRDLVVKRPAPAYRLEWAVSAREYGAGERRSIVFPASLLVLRGTAAGSRPRSALLELGDAPCLGATFAWGKKPVFVGVAALYPDGSEDPAPSRPTRVAPPAKHRRRSPCVAQ